MLQRSSPVEDVGSQEGLTSDCASGVPPVHQEHEDNAEDGGEQGNPLVVILNGSGFRVLCTVFDVHLERGSPVGRVGVV